MKKGTRRSFYWAGGLLIAFAVWTALICLLDVQPIGPNASSVGLATLNGAFHSLTGTHMTLYVITDWLGILPFLIAFGFAGYGLAQWIKRKSLRRVDFSIFVLGGFYLTVAGFYILFEVLTVNYRPILIEGVLEASYPSSTTMLVMCVMPTAWMQLRARIKRKGLRVCVTGVIFAFTVFMVTGRLISGVHWLTDIIGGALLSVGLVMLYRSVCDLKAEE